MKKSVSILGSLSLDFSLFYGASFLILFSLFFFPAIWSFPIVSITVFILIDSGHVYTTLWRTYFRKEEFQRTKNYLYLPTFIFFAVFFWGYFGVPYLWRFVIYFTLFHHIRQYYGVFMWYAKLENYHIKKEHLHFYALVIIPVILFHFRTINYQSLYHPNEFQSLGELPFYKSVLMIFTAYFLWQMYQRLKEFFQLKRGAGLTMAFIYPATLHFICFLIFEHSYQIFLPLLALHGLTYAGLMAISMERLGHPKARGLMLIWGMILSVMIFFPLLEYFLTENFDIFLAEDMLQGKILLSALVSLTLLPNLLHYLYDAFLWKRTHPDFQKILSKQ